MELREPVIIDQLGRIFGRDAIYLDKIEFEGTYSVKLAGQFNSDLCEKTKNIDKFIPYELIFKSILEFKMTEIDLYNFDCYISSFERKINSNKIAEFLMVDNQKLKDSHKHYVFYTYDDVIEIIAEKFEIELKL